MDYPKSVPGIGLVNGKFVDENTTTGTPGSLIPSTWGNSLTDELLNVIQAGGLEPSEVERDQLLEAIRALIETRVNDAAALPVGSMLPFPKGVAPPGFLEVNGSVQSIATYPDLAAYLGTTFNTGSEGVGNFRLPESRGEFLRGWDHGRGVDAGRVLGSLQGDALKAHSHGLPGDTVNGTLDGSADWNTGRTTAPSFNTSFTGDSETRPRNLAVMWCIKAWSSSLNEGAIDIAALAAMAAQATEIDQGTAKVSTDAQMLDGANDMVIATPKKLRKGFAVSFTENGYVVFPTWLGGVIFQWGMVAASGSDAIVPQPFTLAFPTACLGGVVVGNRAAPVTGGTSAWYFAAPTKNGATIVHDGMSSVAMGAYWFSWGY